MRGLLFVLHMIVSTALAGLLAHIVGLPSHSKRAVCVVARWWSAMLLMVAGVKVSSRIAQPLDPHQPYVFVSNHLSHLDAPSLFVTLRCQLSFMAKRSLLYYPIFGSAILAMGVVVIDRHSQRRRHASVDRAAKMVASGRSVFVFPEGLRSPDGSLGEFKKGAFILAIRAGVPLVPICIKGTREVLKPGAISPRPGEVTVSVLPPILTTGMTIDDRDALLAQARAAIQAELETSLR
ncbi:MAG: lysophospholipid acyltransferase family protein [Candidatus Alcyoniella australis]|nr:lysophospholipid acyltransferase family protein [Candidatus Alcyoniella australis]